MKNPTPSIYPAVRAILVFLFVIGLMTVNPALPARASIYTVTNTNDTGAGSLRQAIAGAGDGDTITFSAALSGQTISLSSQIEIQDDVIIDGSNLQYPVAVIASNYVRIFLIDNLATVTINQIVMGNSYDSGAGGGIIISHGDLTITDCTLAGGEVTWFGGAIYNTGDLTISGSTIFGNVANSYGGAIYNEGTLELINSTIYDNSGGSGGGVYNNLGATSTIIHSTFAENTTTNGGSGVQNLGTLTLVNSLLNDNTGGTAECVSSGTLTASHNLISDGSCSASYTSAFLGPLADNGGPTQTMAIGYLSSARNTGDGMYCELADQRGVPRDPTCDIGTYEYATNLVVDSTADPGDGICDLAECTLRDAVATIETNGVIYFHPSLAGGTITLSSEIAISGGLTIDGAALSPPIPVSGGGSTRVFHIMSGADVELSHLEITQGGGVVFGGGIYNEGTLQFSDSVISASDATNIGGGIYNASTLYVQDVTVSGNTAGLYGGGIYNTGSLTVLRSTFQGNDTGNRGGGIYGSSSTSTVQNSTFYDNNAAISGGGIYISGGTLTVHNSTFSDNTVAGDGGGIYNSVGTLNLENSILANSSGGNDCYTSNSSGTRINNLIETGSCGSALSSDPLLGPLADNGGPTHTMALSPISPALDAGDDATCESTDQRGVSRPKGLHCDIGAYEFEFPFALYLPLIMR